MELIAEVGQGDMKLKLNSVLCVPKRFCNLIYVPQLTEKRVVFTLHLEKHWNFGTKFLWPPCKNTNFDSEMLRTFCAAKIIVQCAWRVGNPRVNFKIAPPVVGHYNRAPTNHTDGQ